VTLTLTQQNKDEQRLPAPAATLRDLNPGCSDRRIPASLFRCSALQQQFVEPTSAIVGSCPAARIAAARQPLHPPEAHRTRTCSAICAQHVQSQTCGIVKSRIIEAPGRALIITTSPSMSALFLLCAKRQSTRVALVALANLSKHGLTL
jgi:hypothetical protein